MAARIDALGPWFHNFELGGIWTAPDHFLGDYPGRKFRRIAHDLPADLTGRTVLDIGCNAGFHAFEMKRRGAARVVGIDADPRYLAQARFAASELGFEDIEFVQLSVYDVAALGEAFDVVLFMGVMYHLRHPLLALDLIHEHVARDVLVFQTLQRGATGTLELAPDYGFDEVGIFLEDGFPHLSFIERSYAGDPTNWWLPNPAAAEAMLRSSGFDVERHPEDDVYVCRRVPAPLPGAAVYPARGGRS
ncbi:MAG: TIGR04290 family methyltransferase [Janthinobacterium lividum]